MMNSFPDIVAKFSGTLTRDSRGTPQPADFCGFTQGADHPQRRKGLQNDDES